MRIVLCNLNSFNYKRNSERCLNLSNKHKRAIIVRKNMTANQCRATSLFIYGNGKTGAVKYSGNYKVIYLGFGLESVDSDINTKQGDMSPIRTKVLMNSLNWLNFIEHKPLKDTSEFSLLREVTAKVRSIGPKIKSMTLYWRQKGAGSFNSLLMQNNADTLFFAEIPGQSDSTIVEYYLESEFDYYTWTNPINAPENLYSYKVGNVTDIETEKNQSIEFNLSQNYPNPFNPTTNIKYSIANRKFVELKIYNVLGQEIQTLVNEEKPSGNYQIEFNAANLPSGVYFYRIQAGSFNQVRKMLLIK